MFKQLGKILTCHYVTSATKRNVDVIYYLSFCVFNSSKLQLDIQENLLRIQQTLLFLLDQFDRD